MHVHNLWKSVRYALRGLLIVLRSEQNFRIQLLIAVLVIGAGFRLGLLAWKLVALVLISLMVLVLELANSIFERLVDAFRPRLHPAIADMKDIMAAAVLLASLGAIVMGVILFWPHLASRIG
ncbi:diacylglycerol kinase family protein [Candidatus Uhrbacteria bacterium]|nr:diacylglycerol kinase family protein [Candidatus Uhrbacteria bacterium]